LTNMTFGCLFSSSSSFFDSLCYWYIMIQQQTKITSFFLKETLDANYQALDTR